jgi:hypothetical protein
MNDVQAHCFICGSPVICEKVSNVPILWEDNDCVGFPICFECEKEIKANSKHSEQLINPIERNMRKIQKKGLEQWL